MRSPFHEMSLLQRLLCNGIEDRTSVHTSDEACLKRPLSAAHVPVVGD